MTDGAEKLIKAIEVGGIPRYLYKYTSAENCLKILREKTLYFPNYKEFNDPFECKSIIDTQVTDEQWYRFLTESLHQSKERAIEWIEFVRENPNGLGEQFVKELLSTDYHFGLLCLSSNYDNLLLWAHYAQKHKGCCVKLDLMADPELFKAIRKVEYDDRYPVCNYIHNPEASLDVLFHKSKVWEYECEYRVVSFEQAGVLSVSPAAIRAVYLGCRIGEEDRETIIKAIGLSRTDIYQASTNPVAYGLDFDRVR